MKFFRSTWLLLVSVMMMVLGGGIFVQYQHPNPTGRLVSSAIPADYTDAEYILANDLGVSRNEDSDNITCICSENGYQQTRCNSCLVTLGTRNAIPDFVTTRFIADSKLYERSYFVATDQQTQTFIGASIALDIPLWIYVHVDTLVSQESYDAISMTGGGIVHYFTNNQFDAVAYDMGLLILVLGGLLFGGFIVLRVRKAVKDWEVPEPEDPPRSDTIIEPRDLPDSRAMKAMDDAEKFGEQLRRKIRIEIEDDEPEDNDSPQS